MPDLAEALIRVAERPNTWGRALLAPTAPAVAQRRLVELAAQALGVPPRIKPTGALALRFGGLFVPAAKEVIEMLPVFEGDFVVDSRRSEAELDLSPTPLPEALAAAVGRAGSLGVVGR